MVHEQGRLQNIILTDYLQALLGNTLDCASAPDYIAKQIAVLDKEERYVHIELTDGDYIIWRKASWLMSQRRELYRKTLSERERAVGVRRGELRVVFIRNIKRKTMLDDERAAMVADELITSRNIIAASTFDCDITELLAADDELKKFKEATRTK